MKELVLHRGAVDIDRKALFQIEAPAPEKRWFPVAHGTVVQAVEKTLHSAGFGIETEHFGISQDHHRFFGTLTLSTFVGSGVSLSVGIRNSTDQTFPLGFCAGHRVFVCDNLAFHSELLVKRKHTKFGEERFGEAISLAISTLPKFARQESERIKRFQITDLCSQQADSLLLRAYRADIVSHRQLPHIIDEWEKPTFDDFQERTLWSLFNAFTTVMNQRARTNPQQHASDTMRLQALLGREFRIGFDSPIDITEN